MKYIQRFTKKLLLFLVVVGLTGCAAVAVHSGPHPIKRATDTHRRSNWFSHRVSYNDGIWRDIRNDFVLDDFSDDESVQEQIRWYQKNISSLERYFSHAAPYIYYIYQEIKRRGLPTELALLPILESGYNPLDYSTAGAVGLWQIMPGTASGFGLKMNSWYDGRRDVITSTRAALKYLTYLHEYFNNDWLLAIAAYDAGEGTIQSAVNRSTRANAATDFWSLKLPRETHFYVPRLLALVAIVQNPEKYHVVLPKIEDEEYFKMVDTGGQIDLMQAAQLAGISLESLRKINPAFHHLATDPSGPYSLLLPADKVDIFNERLASLPTAKRIVWHQHVVSRGETLVSLAKQYRVSPSLLRKVNDIKSPSLRIHEVILVPFNYNAAFATEVQTTKTVLSEEKIPGPQQVIHTVKDGETLEKIAIEYHVTMSNILAWNQINAGQTITPNQKLLIWVSEKVGQDLQRQEQQKAQQEVKDRNKKDKKASGKKKHRSLEGVDAEPVKNFAKNSYTIKVGDNLYSIAHHFGVSVDELRKLNRLSGKSLKIGSVIKISSKKARSPAKNITSVKVKHEQHVHTRRHKLS